MVNYETNQLFSLGFDKIDELSFCDPMRALFAQNNDDLSLFLQFYETENCRKGVYYVHNRRHCFFSIEVPVPRPPKKGISSKDKTQFVIPLEISGVANLSQSFFTAFLLFVHPLDKTLFFAANKDQFFTNNEYTGLYTLDFSTEKGKITNIIGFVEPTNKFVGLDYNSFLWSAKHFLHGGKYLVFSSQVEFTNQLFLLKTDSVSLSCDLSSTDCEKPESFKRNLVNLSQSLITRHDQENHKTNVEVLDCKESLLLIKCHKTSQFPYLLLVDLSDANKIELLFANPGSKIDKYEINIINTPRNLLSLPKSKYFEFCLSGFKNIPSVFGYLPCSTGQPKKAFPCVVYIHGGPHSSAYDRFDKIFSFFLSKGVAFMAINYRGSSGYGHQYLQSLNQKSGRFDVEDCVEAILKSADFGIDLQSIFLFGYSHGGYLVSRLINHPKTCGLVRAAFLISGVYSLNLMTFNTDIPGWVRSGFQGQGSPFSLRVSTS